MSFNPAAYPLRIVVKYLLVGFAWIILSDMLVEFLFGFDYFYTYAQTVKGVVFILVTAILLYLILKKDFHEIDSAWQKQKANENRYHTAFEGAPSPLWEKNLSKIKSELERLNLSDSSSVYEYMHSHQTFLQECLEKIEVLDVNRAVLEIFGLKNTEDIKIPCALLLGDSSYTFFKQEIAAVADGRTEFEIKQHIRSDPEEKTVLIRWVVLPGHEVTYERVLISAFDITKLETIKKQLQESEEKYRGLFDNTGEAVMVIEGETILLANSASEKLFDLSLSSLYTKKFNQLVHPDDLSVLEEYSQKALEEMTDNDRLTFRITRGDMEHRLVEVKVSRTPWQGRLVFLMLFTDITEKIRKDQQLKKAKLLLEKVFNSLNEAVFVIDATNRSVVTCNPAVESIFGYTPEEINGKTTRILHLDDSMYEKFDQQSQPILEQKRVFHAQFVMRHKNGNQIITENTVTEIDDVLGWRHGVVSVVRDITDQKLHERALQESEKRYRNLLEDASEGVVVIQDEIIVYTNGQMQIIVGYDDEQLVGSLYLDYVYTADKESIALLYKDLMKGKGFPKDKELRVLNSKGEIRWLRLNAVRLGWNGKPAVMALSTDITEQKLLQEKNKEMEAHIHRAQNLESIGTLAGGIAHDFNNILGAILGYAEMVQEDCPTGSIMRSDIDRVIEASHRAKELVKQILAFSRQAESDKTVLQPALIIKEAMKMLRASLPKTIDIQQNIDPKAGPILADPTQIHQIITNLCTNAFHAMEEIGGTLKVSLKNKELTPDSLGSEPHVKPGQFVEISVGDTGPGIVPEIMDKIFDPFFTTKEIGKGTGMGLAIIHGIAKKSGGFVSCRSSLGEGTTFYVYFPVQAFTAPPEAEMTQLELVQSCIEHILFIDDEEMLAAMGKTMLERLGYRVTVETNGIEALKIIQSQPDAFDLVITDQTMPGMTGSDLARRILQIRPGMPIILCTGFSNQISEGTARSYGIKGFAMKPLAKKDLAVLIRKVLDGE